MDNKSTLIENAPITFDSALKYAESNKLYCHDMWQNGLISNEELIMMSCEHYVEINNIA